MRKLPFKNKFLLAPMEEVNDVVFRLLCKKVGAGLTYTGMISPLTRQNFNCAISSEAFGNRRSGIRGSSKETRGCLLQDKPGLQIFGTSEKGIKEFIKKYDKQVSLWDLNLGCPAKTAKKHGFGSFLKDLGIIEKMLKIMRESTKKPITVKIRKSEISFEILKLAEKYCDAICIHPRTQAQGYSGKPDVEFAEEIKNKTKLPVIFSGNINLKNFKQFLKKFDYLMIGREAIGNPNIFSKLINKDSKIEFKDYLELAEKYELPFKQIKFQAMNFTKRTRNAKKLRLKIFEARNIEELKEIYEG